MNIKELEEDCNRECISLELKQSENDGFRKSTMTLSYEGTTLSDFVEVVSTLFANRFIVNNPVHINYSDIEVNTNE